VEGRSRRLSCCESVRGEVYVGAYNMVRRTSGLLMKMEVVRNVQQPKPCRSTVRCLADADGGVQYSSRCWCEGGELHASRTGGRAAVPCGVCQWWGPIEVTRKVGHYYSADHGSVSAFSVWSAFHHISDFTLQQKLPPLQELRSATRQS
jgi:hypothetical protein